MNSAFELTGEQQHQAHSPRDGVLTVSNCTHKSMVAAIFRFASTLQGRRPASTRIRKPPTTVSSAVRTALPALHHSTPFAPRGCHPPPVSLSSLDVEMRLLSDSSQISAQDSRIYAFSTWCLTKSSVPITVDNSRYRNGCLP